MLVFTPRAPDWSLRGDLGYGRLLVALGPSGLVEQVPLHFPGPANVGTFLLEPTDNEGPRRLSDDSRMTYRTTGRMTRA